MQLTPLPMKHRALGSALLSLVFLVSVATQILPLQIILSIPVMLYIPGYFFLEHILLSKNGPPLIDPTYKSVLAVAFSIELILLLGLSLHLLAVPIDELSVTGGVFAWNACASMGAWARSTSGSTLQPNRMVMLPGPAWSNREILISAISVVTLVSVVAVAAIVLTTPRTVERWTEVSLLDEVGGTDYPYRLSGSRSENVTLVVVNHEGQAIDYVASTILTPGNFYRNETGSSVFIANAPSINLQTHRFAIEAEGVREIAYSLPDSGPGTYRLAFEVSADTVPLKSVGLYLVIE